MKSDERRRSERQGNRGAALTRSSSPGFFTRAFRSSLASLLLHSWHSWAKPVPREEGKGEAPSDGTSEESEDD